MPISQNFAVTIEFAGAAPFTGGAQSDRSFATRKIRLVESYVNQIQHFTLHEVEKPEYILTTDETARLSQMLGQMEVKVPWQGYAGFDGTDYELALLGAMSSVTFRWWVQVPSEWEQAGRVFDFVLEIADRS